MQPVPTVNVNLNQCNHAAKMHPDHASYCDTHPIHLPCPLPPSVAFEVRLGACICEAFAKTGAHHPRCHKAARPIRVSCSISGKTWAESEVGDVETDERLSNRGLSTGDMLRLDALARERWALVKTLVMGGRLFPSPVSDAVVALVAQRDAVYAALAEVARAEEVLNNAAGVSATALRACGASLPKRTLVLLAMAEADLAAYVEHLIEQVGVLP